MVFTKTEETLLKQLQEQKENLTKGEKLKIIRMLLDPYEQKVFDAVLEQDGITQQTLRYRTDLTKSKISEILSRFERKNIIIREKKGKTYSIYLKAAI